ENIDALGLFGQTRIHRRDATDLGLRPAAMGEPFELALLDPPYRKGLGEKALDGLAAGGWLKPGAVVMFERASDEADVVPAAYEALDARDYGAARVQFLRFR
ncbi:MAG: RsmD family RNA methyltransferase, partial [Caulobacter sp.]